MKIAICGDLHMCKSSSIVTANGTKYSKRLENCVNTLNWVESLADEQSCDMIIYLGDIFNKAVLDQETVTALADVAWSKLPHEFIVGNHDSEDSDLGCNVVYAVEGDNRIIVPTPKTIKTDSSNLVLLPYITEANRKPLASYLSEIDSSKPTIIFAHNDIAGINYGPVVSTVGFNIDEIIANCRMFIDGHLHNGQWIRKNRIRTLGTITGQNFGEDAFTYRHNVMILDTNSMSWEDFENPYAYNFYQLEINDSADMTKLNKVGPNAVLSIKCKENIKHAVDDFLKAAPETLVAASRVITVKDATATTTEADIDDLMVDHIQKFVDCCHEKLGNDPILEQELAEICK